MSLVRPVASCALRAACLISVPLLLPAQQRPAPADSLAHRDSVARLQVVTVTAAPAERGQPSAATRIDAATIRQTPARSTYELLRQAAGVEVHEQGQGPGFA